MLLFARARLHRSDQPLLRAGQAVEQSISKIAQEVMNDPDPS